MTAKIIDGKEIAKHLRTKLHKEIKEQKAKPGLAVVLVGDNPASQVYVNMKEKACIDTGIYSEKYILDKETSLGSVIELINTLNNNPNIHGILVQMPLPKNIDSQLVIDCIRPDKDVDGLHPLNLGNLLSGNNIIVPCTPKGIIKLIESTKIDLQGKHCVVIGRSNLVGKPVSLLLQQKHATVTMCHSRTKELDKICKEADVIIAAVGVPKLVKGSWVKKGAIVIDVGTNKVTNDSEKGYHLCGDVDFDEVKKIAGFITPSPGGVGPMTIACLLENTFDCYRLLKTD